LKNFSASNKILSTKIFRRRNLWQAASATKIYRERSITSARSQSSAQARWTIIFFDQEPPWYFPRGLIEKVIIADGVTKIGEYAFRECENVTSVKIPVGVEKISDSAFFGCYGLTNIEIPASVKKIGKSAFRYCEELTSVTISDGVEEIGGSAFVDCNKLTSVKNIGSGAFYGCTSLEKIFYPAGADFDWELSASNDAELIPY